MATYSTSTSINIPSNIVSITVRLKGEGGAGATAWVYNPYGFGCCNNFGYANQPGSGYRSTGHQGAEFNGHGGDTSFLGVVAGGGRGGGGLIYPTGSYIWDEYNGVTSTPSPVGDSSGGTYTIPTGVTPLTIQTGNSGQLSASTNSVKLGGVGPGGDGSNGSLTSRPSCGNQGYNSQCCPSNGCGFFGGQVGSSYVVQYILYGSPVYADGAGGGAGAYVEARITSAYLQANSYLGTQQSLILNEGDSGLDNGSAEIIFNFGDVYIKTSLGWQLVKNIYVNQSEVGIGWTTSVANLKNYGW